MKSGFLRYIDISILCYTFLLLISSYSSAKTTKENPIDVAKEILGTGRKIRVALFIPDTRVKPLLLGLIQSEEKSIYLAQFRLNDKDVVQALIDAHKRGVVVKVITDQSSFFDKYNKIKVLMDAGIDIRWYKVPFSIMHHKFFIFGKNLTKESILITGSANMTVSGYTKNQEVLHAFNDRSLIASYERQFAELIKRTVKEMPLALASAKKLAQKVLILPSRKPSEFDKKQKSFLQRPSMERVRVK